MSVAKDIAIEAAKALIGELVHAVADGRMSSVEVEQAKRLTVNLAASRAERAAADAIMRVRKP